MFRRFYLQNYNKIWYRWWKFRRWYCQHQYLGHKRWVDRVMRREFGITKESFKKGA